MPYRRRRHLPNRRRQTFPNCRQHCTCPAANPTRLQFPKCRDYPNARLPLPTFGPDTSWWEMPNQPPPQMPPSHTPDRSNPPNTDGTSTQVAFAQTPGAVGITCQGKACTLSRWRHCVSMLAQSRIGGRHPRHRSTRMARPTNACEESEIRR